MKIRFTARADTDIVESYLYGYSNFGRDQAERYERDLRQVIDVIAENPRIASERSEYDPPVRIHHHARHYIINLVHENEILVVRVLRDGMDLARHLL
jgi:toxin ParE1/3/4